MPPGIRDFKRDLGVQVAGARLAACKSLSSNAFFTASEIFNTTSFLCYSVEILISESIAG